MALLITVASVDIGVVSYVTSLTHNWFGWNFNPAHHSAILVVALILLAIQTTLNITGTRVMAHVAKIGVYVEIVGTFGIALILRDPRLPSRPRLPLHDAAACSTCALNPLGLNFQRPLVPGAALISVLAPVYIFYGFESAGDISEETKDAGRQVPRAMRLALIWGGIASFVLTAALLLSMP